MDEVDNFSPCMELYPWLSSIHQARFCYSPSFLRQDVHNRILIRYQPTIIINEVRTSWPTTVHSEIKRYLSEFEAETERKFKDASSSDKPILSSRYAQTVEEIRNQCPHFYRYCTVKEEGKAILISAPDSPALRLTPYCDLNKLVKYAKVRECGMEKFSQYRDKIAAISAMPQPIYEELLEYLAP
jgi:hypothetical protein